MSEQFQIVIDVEREGDGTWNVGSPTCDGPSGAGLTLTRRARRLIEDAVDAARDESEEAYQDDQARTQACERFHDDR